MTRLRPSYKIHISLLLGIIISFGISLVIANPVAQSGHDHHHHHGHHSMGGDEESYEDDYYEDEYYYEDEDAASEPASKDPDPEPSADARHHAHTVLEADDADDGDSAMDYSDHQRHQHHHEMTETEMTPRKDDPNIPKDCTQAPVSGMCRGAFPMFYFDPKTRQCKQFVYGGCRGNMNVHRTAEDCYKKCYPMGMDKSATLISTRVSQNDYLTIRSGTGASVLTFTGKEAAAKVDPPVLSDFTIKGVYVLKLHFRTDKPHGLIAFLRQMKLSQDVDGQRIQLYVFLKKGHFGVTHIYDGKTETFVMRRGGLQGGTWHSVSVKIDSSNGELTLDVDSQQEYFTIGALGLKPHYGGVDLDGFQSVLWVGGVFDNEVSSEEMSFGMDPFHGCMQKLSLSSGPTSQDMVTVKPLVATRHTGVKEHCANNCNDNFKNLCSRKSHCVEHFDHSTCDCFDSGQDGPKCKNPDIPVLSMNGDGYVVHRLYEWMDRVQSYTNRISVAFKTRFSDSILLYASAEHPERQYLAASITRQGTIYFEVNLGAGAVSAEIGKSMDAEVWHTLNIIHQHEKIDLYIDSRLHATLTLPGDIRYFHFDPDFYLGNAPHLSRACGLPLDAGRSEPANAFSCSSSSRGSSYRYHYDKSTGTCLPFNYTGCGGNANRFDDERTCMETCHVPGLRSFYSFMGCMQTVFFNDISILQALKEQNRTTRYYGSTKEPFLGSTCNDAKFLSLTFSTERSAMILMNPEPSFHLAISFRPTEPRGVLASGEVDLLRDDSVGIWELRHDSNHVYFYIHENLLNMKSEAKIKLYNWQYVDIQYKSGRINMMVNNVKQGHEGPGKLTFSPEINIGKNILQDFPGYIGCIRKLILGRNQLDLRSVVGTPMANKGVTYDNCQVLGPCQGPRACEHGGKCSVDEDDEIKCDCSGTGYTGKTCHFSLYKKSCEQYRQIGLKNSGIYRIDLDGNGPLPPAYVKCSFNPLLRETYTTVDHNVEEEYEVRKPGIKDFRLDVQYRDFSPEMLTDLIGQSKSCSQEVEYHCRRAPLKLSTRTWFSSPAKKFISNFGTIAPGVCKCKERNSCEKRDVSCNCDINDGLLRRDKGIFSNPDHLPITSMVFVQGEDQREETEAHITLKPLTCIAEAYEEQTVSFTDSSSYLEVPAWREGSLSFAFRTTSQAAIVAYQPAYHPRHATFMIALKGDKELDFMYRYKGEAHHQTVRSLKSLNDGEWQHVLVDVYNQQLRFVINSEEKMIDVDPNAYLGVLDGSMFLGGIPEQFREEEKHSEHVKLDGLVGCIKGLTLNEEVVNMERLFRTSSHGVALGCAPACDPNPCQNGGRCVDMWGSYKCECSNPLAHSGRNCEYSLNTEGLTFMSEESKYKYFDNDTVHRGEKLFNETFYLNFRTHAEKGLLLFAYNYLHNFVQLHLASPNEIVFLFNHGSEVKKMSVTTKDDVVFNNAQSVQVKVLRTNTSTSLHVYTEGKYYKDSLPVGWDLLQEDEYEQFPFGGSQPLPEMVYYPHSMTKPRPFLLVYLGSANDKQHDIRSEIPGFRGCIRGVKIGDTLMPLRRMLSTSPYSTDGVVPECKMACDKNPCLNGGLCTEDFQFYSNFHCDCKGTSYTGATCNSEIAYTFRGKQWIKQDTSYSPLDSDFTLELAFSTSKRLHEPQSVSLMRSTNPSSIHDYVLVWVGADGSIVVEAQLHNVDEDNVRGAKVRPSEDNISAFDGQRHHVLVQLKDDQLTVKIDQKEREVKVLKKVYVSQTAVKVTPTSLYLGGIESGVDDRMLNYKEFHGCISNVKISTPAEEYYPLRQYSDGDLHLDKMGIPAEGQCAGFGQSGFSFPMMMAQALSVNASSVIGSEWVYKRPEKMPIPTVSYVKGHPERDTVFDNVVPTVAGIVLGGTLIIVVVLLLKLYLKKRRNQGKIQNEEEDTKPLFNGRSLSIRYETRQNTMVLASDNQETIPLKSAPDGIPVTSLPVPKEEVTLTKKSAEASSESPVEEIKQAERVPDKAQDDIPEAPPTPPAEEKASPKDKVDVDAGEEEIQVHSDEVQEEKVRPSSFVDTSSESSIECTIDINVTPPASHSASPKPAYEVSDEVATVLPTSKDQTNAVEDESDPEPVLKKYVSLEEEDKKVEPEELKSTAEDYDGELKQDVPNAADDSKLESNDSKQSEDSKVEIDFSSVPVIKIERSQSETDVVVDDDVPDSTSQRVEPAEVEPQSSLEIGETEAVVETGGAKAEDVEESAREAEKDEEEVRNTDAGGETPPEKEKKGESEEDFIEYRDDSVKVEDAQRMSKTLAEIEAPSVTSAASEPEPETEPTDNVNLTIVETTKGPHENIPFSVSVTENGSDVSLEGEAIVNKEDDRTLGFEKEENVSALDESEANFDDEEGPNPGELTENDLFALKQWSEKQRNDSEGNGSVHKLSISSDSDEYPFGSTYHSYINYGLDDNDVMQDLTDLPHHAAHLQHHDDAAAHLDTIQESDETDEDDVASERKVTIPSLLNSNLSAGMLNLNDISSGSREELDSMREENNDDENSEEDPLNRDEGTENKREGCTGTSSKINESSEKMQVKEIRAKDTAKELLIVENEAEVISNTVEKLANVESDMKLQSNYEDNAESLHIVEHNEELPSKDENKVDQLLITKNNEELLSRGKDKTEQLLIVESDDVLLPSKGKSKEEELRIIESHTDLLSEEENNEELRFVRSDTELPSERKNKEEELIIVESETDFPSKEENRDQLPGDQLIGASAIDRKSDGLLKKGKVMKGKKDNPIFLSDNLRTFSNPISYLGGPPIEYEDTGEGRLRNDSLTSTTSLD